MWACAKGQTDAALTLYHWNSGPLRVCNKDGHLPLAVAHQRGHHNLATQLEQLEQAHFKAPAPAPAKVGFFAGITIWSWLLLSLCNQKWFNMWVVELTTFVSVIYILFPISF